MTTIINDISDLLRIIREQPEWGDALRGALLGQELLELPQRFAEFVAIVDKRFAALESDVAELKEDVKEIKGELNKQSGEIGNLRGAAYEQKIASNIRSIVIQHLKLRKVNVLKGYKVFDEMPFYDLIGEASDRGVIDGQQLTDVSNLDIVLQGQSHPEGSLVYAAFEVSIRVADDDITRASTRAAILGQMTGEQTLPIVIGANIDEARQKFAAEQGVTLITVAESRP